MAMAIDTSELPWSGDHRGNGHRRAPRGRELERALPLLGLPLTSQALAPFSPSPGAAPGGGRARLCLGKQPRSRVRKNAEEPYPAPRSSSARAARARRLPASRHRGSCLALRSFGAVWLLLGAFPAAPPGMLQQCPVPGVAGGELDPGSRFGGTRYLRMREDAPVTSSDPANAEG